MTDAKPLVLLALLGLAAAGPGQDTNKTVSIPPATRYTAYQVPPGGAALQLTIEAASGAALDDSTILLQHESDDVQWSLADESAEAHRYRIGPVFSSREYIHVFGHWHYIGGGGGSGTPPTFDVKAAAVDVDVAATPSVAETVEESMGVWIPKGGARRQVSLAAVQCPGTSEKQTLSWSASLDMWDAPTGGQPVPSGSDNVSADAHTYYAQGAQASASVRDAHIQAAYVSGSGTAVDRVNVTVVGATTTPFTAIAEGACTNLTVTLAPNPPGTNVTVQLACLGGTGEARFLPSGSLSTTLTGSATLQLTGVTASSTASNMLLSVLLGEDALVSNRFSVIKAEIENTASRDTDDIQVQHFTNSAGTFTYTAIPLQLYYTISPTNGWTPDSVELRIKNPEGTTVRTVALPASSGQQSTNWDGKTDGGEFVPYGSNYVVEIAATIGATTCTATNGLTVYEIREGNCLYRWFTKYGQYMEHAAILYEYNGANKLTDLQDDNKYVVAEHEGDGGDTTTHNYGGWNTWLPTPDGDGAYCPPGLTRANRKSILENCYVLVQATIPYCATDVLYWQGDDWNGTLADIAELRCDGFVEAAYEALPVQLYGAGTETNWWSIMTPGGGSPINWTPLYRHARASGQRNT